jgi:LmbE family N-acetylglucosaminyl deacetylase
MKKKVLVIACHPDDEVLGVGGTIAKHTKIFGDEVHVLILTEGCSSQYRHLDNVETLIENKREEARQANGILGVSKVDFANLPDMRLDSLSHTQVNQIIETKIKEFEPEIVYTHLRNDVNKDHQIAFHSTIVATRPSISQSVRRVISYVPVVNDYWLAQGFTPNYFVNTEDTILLKLKAMSFYQTELCEYPHPRSLLAIKSKDKFYGSIIFAKYAEAFVLHREIK